ncbi:MAG: hypothetical protein ACW967_07320 [Candidatus Hodarchaeales archaeon]|jgi:hypothetical protein
MRIESLLDAIQTPKERLFQKKSVCNCQYGEIVVTEPKKLNLKEKCSFSCVCAVILNEKKFQETIVEI